MKKYSKSFYKTIEKGALNSAHSIIPILLEIYTPQSVLDIGCGSGAWLSVFMQHGIEEVIGIDGPWIDANALLIPKERFIAWDLSKPLTIERQFDLVISLEVAEHIENTQADNFISTLASHGSVVLFSSAIPFQEGKNHINEQWPDYWLNLFERRDFVAIDYIREKIWRNDNVDYWYAQNILIFSKRAYLETHPSLKRAYELTAKNQLSMVHPRLWLQTHANLRSPKSMIKMLPLAILKALKRKLSKSSLL